MEQKIILFMITLCFIFAGCTQEAEPILVANVENESEFPSEEERIGEESMKHSNYDRNYDIVLQIVDDVSQGKNIVFSPTSFDYALGMVSMGANNETKDAFEEYFGLDIENASMRHLGLSEEWEKNDNVEITVSNVVACDNSIVLNSDYYALVQERYNAEVVDTYHFLNDAPLVAGILNTFCKESTNGMIPTIVTEQSVKEQKLLIVNALYFNGKWESPFNERQVKDGNFSNGDGSVSNVTSMTDTGTIYFEGGNATGFSKYYSGRNLEFVGMLPNEDICDENGNFDLTDIDLDAFFESRTTAYDVNYMIPKFKMESTSNLSDVLQNTPLAPIFQSNADFSNMSSTPVCVSEVIQKVVVDVNEEGTEAAAVTSIGMKLTCMPEAREVKTVYLNRPFVFFIYDKTNDEILFMGKISSL